MKRRARLAVRGLARMLGGRASRSGRRWVVSVSNAAILMVFMMMNKEVVNDVGGCCLMLVLLDQLISLVKWWWFLARNVYCRKFA